MRSLILQRGYEKKLKDDLSDAEQIGTEYRIAHGKFLTQEQLRSLINALRRGDIDGYDEQINDWYAEHWPEILKEGDDIEERLQETDGEKI